MTRHDHNAEDVRARAHLLTVESLVEAIKRYLTTLTFSGSTIRLTPQLLKLIQTTNTQDV